MYDEKKIWIISIHESGSFFFFFAAVRDEPGMYEQVLLGWNKFFRIFITKNSTVGLSFLCYFYCLCGDIDLTLQPATTSVYTKYQVHMNYLPRLRKFPMMINSNSDKFDFIYLIVRIAWHQRLLNVIWRGLGVVRLRFIFDARTLQNWKKKSRKPDITPPKIIHSV